MSLEKNSLEQHRLLQVLSFCDVLVGQDESQQPVDSRRSQLGHNRSFSFLTLVTSKRTVLLKVIRAYSELK